MVHHNINTERSIPARRRVHSVPLDDTLTVVADDFLLPELVPELGPAPAALLELPAAVTCPDISENKNKERACGEPISMTAHGRY